MSISLLAGDVALRRAADTDLDAVVALQQAAYARNRDILGVEPLPLQADYADILGAMEVWLAGPPGALAGALILEPGDDHLLVWSIATQPAGGQGKGLGRKLLAAAETRATELGLKTLRLYTGTPLTHLVAWYGRHGYATERIEQMPDRSVTHMVKRL